MPSSSSSSSSGSSSSSSSSSSGGGGDCTAVPQPIIPCEAGAEFAYISGACPHVGHVLNGSLKKTFGGATNYVSVPNVSGIQTEGDVSITMWISPAISHTTRTAIFGHFDHSEWAGVVVFTDTNKIGFGLRENLDATSFWSRQTSSTVVAPGGWYHIAAVYEAGATPLIYINGSNATTSNLWGGTGISNWTDPNINALIGGGEAFNNTPQYFQGDISNVAYYVRPLSAAEVLGEYEAGCPASLTGTTGSLYGYWPLDGNFTDISDGSLSIGDGTGVGSVPDEIDITRPVTQIKQEDLDISAISATTALYYTIWQDPVFEDTHNYGARLDEITLHYTAAGGGGGGGAANIITASDTLVSNTSFSTVSGNAVIIDSRDKFGVKILAMNSAFDCTLRKDTSGGDIISYVSAGQTKLRASIAVPDGTDVYLDGASNTTLTYCWTHSPIV